MNNLLLQTRILFHRDESRFAKGCSRLRVTAAGKAFLDMLGVFAEFESNLRRERQLEGIALAETRGVSKGLKPSVDVAEVRRLRHDAATVAVVENGPRRSLR
jgi:DNA invertase Pin-like site-specific DNA recombinase